MKTNLKAARPSAAKPAAPAADAKPVRLVVEVDRDMARAVKRAAIDADLSIKDYVIAALSAKLER